MMIHSLMTHGALMAASTANCRPKTKPPTLKILMRLMDSFVQELSALMRL